MTVQSTLRARGEALLFNGSGASPWVLAAGHFHAVAEPRSTLETHPLDSIERAAQLVFRPRTPLGRTNPINGYGLYQQRLFVRVGYLVTGAGGDVPERAGEQSGSGVDDAVEDRIATDRHMIENVLGWQPNWAAVTDPSVIDCNPDGDGAEVIVAGPRRISVVPFLLTFRAALPGSYGPSL